MSGEHSEKDCVYAGLTPEAVTLGAEEDQEDVCADDRDALVEGTPADKPATHLRCSCCQRCHQKCCKSCSSSPTLQFVQRRCCNCRQRCNRKCCKCFMILLCIMLLCTTIGLGIAGFVVQAKAIQGLRKEVSRLSKNADELRQDVGLQYTTGTRFYMEHMQDCPGDNSGWKTKAGKPGIISYHKGKHITLEECKRLCDANRKCTGLTFERDFKGVSKSGSLCVLRSKTCKVPVGRCNDKKYACYFSYRQVDPPLCPGDVPDTDPYWYQYKSRNEKRDASHCQGATCKAWLNNGQRRDLLRKIMKTTDELMTKLGVRYTTVGGTVIGVERCQEVVPWDEDLDIQILADDRNKLWAIAPGPAGPFENETVVSLNYLGYPDYVLVSRGKSLLNCFPWRLTHVPTAAFVDIFMPLISMDTDGNKTSTRLIFTERSKAKKYQCDPKAMWKHPSYHGAHTTCSWNRCETVPYDVIWPSRRCKFADFEIECANQQEQYLGYQFFEALVPDQRTRFSP